MPVSATHQKDSHDAGPVLCGCKSETTEVTLINVPYMLLISLTQQARVIFQETEYKEKRIHTTHEKNKPY